MQESHEVVTELAPSGKGGMNDEYLKFLAVQRAAGERHVVTAGGGGAYVSASRAAPHTHAHAPKNIAKKGNSSHRQAGPTGGAA